MSQEISLKLPSGDVKVVKKGITGLDVAGMLSQSLAKSALAVKIDNILKDAYLPIENGGTFEVITESSPEGLEIMRHDCAHLLANAVLELFPGTQVVIGPTIENGFYYDFARETPFTTQDFAKIEAKMREISGKKIPVQREVWPRDAAIELFKKMGEHYKVQIIAEIPAGDELSLYRQGDFIDLCRGPHAPHTGFVKHFKLLKVSGSYFKGDHTKGNLQRIYGTCFASKEALEDYLHMLSEAERRDHRKIGVALGLFHTSEAAVGSVFWHKRGWYLFTKMQDYMRRKFAESGYDEVRTPILLSKELWDKSGHWEKYRENMFISESEKRTLAIKPMNCPAHIEIFKQGIKSYKDLPIRLAEFGSCHRNEPSGSLHGIMRVRGFTQDDAHIFCTEAQITAETISFCRFLMDVYRDFGFTDVKIKFSDRPQKRAGSDEIWDKAENSLKEAIKQAGYDFEINKGEGAFYGPKLEFVLTDALKREWQCGTLQVDFVLPERLDAEYVTETGARARPVILHRAIFGSFERFIGILIEHFEGKFPLWLAPTAVAVCTITNACDNYAIEVANELKKHGIQAELDIENEKITYKIRKYSVAKVPYIAVIGEEERDSGKVAVRKLGSTANIALSRQEFLANLLQQMQDLT